MYPRSTYKMGIFSLKNLKNQILLEKPAHFIYANNYSKFQVKTKDWPLLL